MARQLSQCRKQTIMKKSIFIAAGVALAGAAYYFWQSRKKEVVNDKPEKENERHHLTNIFSKAKQVAIGN
jgi:uncharacterized protein HemX